MENYLDDVIGNLDSLRITESDEVDQCGISDYLLILLSGGVPDPSIGYLKVEITVTSPCVYEVEITTNSYVVTRTINFKTRVINNYLMRVAEPNKGIGTNLFFNQIVAARKYKFEEIRVSATHGPGFNGYYHWARMGYSMRYLDEIKFQKWCSDRNYQFNNIFEALLDSEASEKWKQEGFSWSGIFNLDNGSVNLDLFHRYLSLKGLDGFAHLL